LFNPNGLQKFLSYLLLPITLIYCLIVFLKYKKSKPIDFKIPIISVGNLIVGGSGKTPVTIALASRYDDVCIILRGYGRSSKGLVEVSSKGKILSDVSSSGDEAMLYALSLNNASVIVSEDRIKAIEKAKVMGSKIIFLDDGYSKHFIKKYSIVIQSDFPYNFCLPSGAMREYLWDSKAHKSIYENIDFTRDVFIKDKTLKMVLVTAISKPQRLDKFLEQETLLDKIYFQDHYHFKKEELTSILKRYNATSLLVTRKDFVKVKDFNLPLSILELNIKINTDVIQGVDQYIKDKKEVINAKKN